MFIWQHLSFYNIAWYGVVWHGWARHCAVQYRAVQLSITQNNIGISFHNLINVTDLGDWIYISGQLVLHIWAIVTQLLLYVDYHLHINHGMLRYYRIWIGIIYHHRVCRCFHVSLKVDLRPPLPEMHIYICKMLKRRGIYKAILILSPCTKPSKFYHTHIHMYGSQSLLWAL